MILNKAWQARSVVFRFCKVEDAVRFKAALSRDEDWEQCNIHYAGDPWVDMLTCFKTRVLTYSQMRYRFRSALGELIDDVTAAGKML